MHQTLQRTTVKRKTFLQIHCQEHDEVYQVRQDDYKVKGCPYCGGRKLSFKAFVDKANKIHNNKFTYLKDKFTEVSSPVGAICPIHGEITLSTGVNHLNNRGCNLCRLENSHYYTKTKFIEICANKKAIFYIIRCFNNTESFYKIGITKRTVEERYNSKAAMPYMYEVIRTVHGDAEQVWDLEQEYKQKLKQYHYVPAIKFNGFYSECFHSIELV